MSQPTNKPDKMPDTATTYERARPEKESPSGQLHAPHPPKPNSQDHLQKQNTAPDRNPKSSEEEADRERA